MLLNKLPSRSRRFLQVSGSTSPWYEGNECL